MVKYIIRDRATGQVKLNLGDRPTKYSGEVTTTAGQAGSVVVPGSPQDGAVWFTATSLTESSMYYGYLGVSLSGSVISWDANFSAQYLIIYGRY